MRQPSVVRRAAELVVAILLAAAAATVHSTFVFSTFETFRLGGLTGKVHASHHFIRVALPDVSALHGRAAVLSLELQNTLLLQRQIALSRDGFPSERVALPPNRTVRRDIVLSPQLVQALAKETGSEARTLEITGDADGWALADLEIRNYHVRLGDRPMLVVLPDNADGYTAGAAFTPAAIVLGFLALAVAFVPAVERKPLRLISNVLAGTSCLVCLGILLLPRLSPYKVLLPPSVFWAIAAALFSPVLLPLASICVAGLSPWLWRCASRVGAMTRRLELVVGGYWTRHDVTFERGAILFGLTAIAIAQPIFDVVSNSPEFFAARGTTVTTAVTALLALCFGVPLGLLAIERAMRAVSRRAAAIFHGATLAVLSAAVVMPWLRQIDVLVAPWDAALGGLAAAIANARSRLFRQFLTVLAPAALVVPAFFVADPGVRQSLLPTDAVAPVQAVERTPPIVLVVFDEFPLNSLLTAEGTIDALRYPNFAALAREGYWFRNASSVASDTSRAVPAILSGRYPTAENDVPTLQYYPVNLFTTLASHYDIRASFRFQKLCPIRTCHDSAGPSADSVASLLPDLGFVWLHIVLPQTLAEMLPPVTDDWAEFGRTRETQAGELGIGRGGVFAGFLSAIDRRPARLYFIHSMLPHMAFEYVPSGRRYRGPVNETQTNRRGRLFERASPAFADAFHQRHLAQVGFVDRLIGNLIERLREVGAYDDALVIITADHGASYREGRGRREPQPQRNLSDILRVPLLMKLPGQRQGEVVDRIVETIDILPTILDVLGANTSLQFDGRSLVDSRGPERSSRTFVWRDPGVAVRTVEDLSAERAESVERKERRFGRGDQAGLYAPPGAQRLLGVSGASLQPLADVQITVHDRAQFRAVNLAGDPLPLYVRGVLDTRRSEPVTVAVVVNGVVAAVTHSYRDRRAHMFSTLIPEASLRDGDNRVAAIALEAGSK